MKWRLLVYICLLFTAAAVFVHPAKADDAQATSEMTDAHIQRIKSNCGEAQRTIQQLHASDALLRVDRGELYESISTKLMAPFNSRLVLNKLDGSSLVKITAAYNRALVDFRSHFKSYDDQVSSVLEIDCKKQPVGFYDAVSEARKFRSQVHADVVALNQAIGNYGKAFTTFQDQFDAGRTTGESD